MFDNYKKTLTKQEKKQFAAIQKQLVPLFNDFDRLDTFNTCIDQKIMSLKSSQAKEFYQKTKNYINETITQLQEIDKAYNIDIYPDDIKDLRPPLKTIFGQPLSPFEELFINQLSPTEVDGLFLSSVVKRLKADSLPKDSILRPYTFYTLK